MRCLNQYNRDLLEWTSPSTSVSVRRRTTRSNAEHDFTLQKVVLQQCTSRKWGDYSPPSCPGLQPLGTSALADAPAHILLQPRRARRCAAYPRHGPSGFRPCRAPRGFSNVRKPVSPNLETVETVSLFRGFDQVPIRFSQFSLGSSASSVSNADPSPVSWWGLLDSLGTVILDALG